MAAATTTTGKQPAVASLLVDDDDDEEYEDMLDPMLADSTHAVGEHLYDIKKDFRCGANYPDFPKREDCFLSIRDRDDLVDRLEYFEKAKCIPHYKMSTSLQDFYLTRSNWLEGQMYQVWWDVDDIQQYYQTLNQEMPDKAWENFVNRWDHIIRQPVLHQRYNKRCWKAALTGGVSLTMEERPGRRVCSEQGYWDNPAA